MSSNSWYVLTGGPSSGKTSVIEELKKLGYNTIKESARYYTEKELAKGRTLKEIRSNEKAFQEEIFRQKQIIHEALSTDVVTFFDRGYHDSLAYLKHFGHKIDKYISDVSYELKYKKVFLLDMLPYTRDNARIEDRQTAEKLHKAVAKAYEESGHEIIRVPVMSVKKRAKFIIDNLDSDEPTLEE